jgi:hypothetical protein
MDSPRRMPGIIPAKKRDPTDIDMVPPHTSMRILGGMITPITAEQAVIAMEKFLSYPSSIIAGIRTLPMPAASALDDPEIPANSIDTNTLI